MGFGEGVSPSPTGEGSGEVAIPLARIFFEFLSRNGAFLCILQSAAVILGQRMPDVEGQWDFYPNLRLKIKHTLSACGTFYAKSYRFKKYATTTIISQMLSQTVQLALSGGSKGGGQPGHVPRSGCAQAAGWPLRGRQQQPVD